MKKKDIILLVLCIIYSIINIIYIFSGSDASLILGIIQFIAIYVPFFILIFYKDKKYALYISLAFCGFELLVSVFEYISYIAAFLNNFKEMFVFQTIIVVIGKIISNIIKVYLIINIVSVLKEENQKNVKIIYVLFVLLSLTIISYIVASRFEIMDILSSAKDLILNTLLIVFVINLESNCHIKTN